MGADKDRYSNVLRRMWCDEKFVRLSAPKEPSARYLWVWLLTGTHNTNIPGLFVMGVMTMAEAHGWPLAGTQDCFQELLGARLVHHEYHSRTIWMPRALHHNRPANPNIVKHWRHNWQELPECDLRETARRAMRQDLVIMGENFAKAFDEVTGHHYRKHGAKGSLDRSGNGSANGSSDFQQTQEQEQEQEQDSSGIVKPALPPGGSTAPPGDSPDDGPREPLEGPPAEPRPDPAWMAWRDGYRERYGVPYLAIPSQTDRAMLALTQAAWIAVPDCAPRGLDRNDAARLLVLHWFREYLADDGYPAPRKHPLPLLVNDVAKYGTPWDAPQLAAAQRERRAPALPEAVEVTAEQTRESAERAARMLGIKLPGVATRSGE